MPAANNAVRSSHPRHPASRTTPPGPRTAYSHPKCYAGELGDCSRVISREHYISKNVLDRLKVTEAAGFAWREHPDELVPVSPASLTARVLCERHNASLSPLDKEAGRFIDTLLRVDHALRDSAPPVTPEEAIFNGADIERWMLKVVAGMAYGRVLRATSMREHAPVPQILFGERDWPPGWGLSVRPPREPIWGHQGLEVQTLVHDGCIWGAQFALGGAVFSITLGRPDALAKRRPAGLRFDRADQPGTKTITLAWPKEPRSPYLRFVRIGQYDGPRPQDAQLHRSDQVSRADK